MVIAALVTFAILFIAWLAAPSGEPIELPEPIQIELVADAA